jgi:hypothetical protein
VGFDWVKAADVLNKMEEELREIREVVEQPVHNHEGAKARRHEATAWRTSPHGPSCHRGIVPS